MDLMQAISALPGIGPYLPYLVVVVAVAALVATQMPPPRPTGSEFYAMFYNIMQWIAMNWGHAKNAPAPTPPPAAPPAA